MTLRVVVADDHPLFRDGLAAALSALPDVDVVARAGDGQRAVEAVASSEPDVLIVDLHMPPLGGLEAIRQVRKDSPDVAVLVLTMVQADDAVSAALAAGAQGYVLKGADAAEIARALEVVAHGGIYLSPALAGRLPDLFRASEGDDRFPQLTPREHEVLTLVAAGLTNAAIASRLQLSPKTVRNLVSAVITKLDAHDREHVAVLVRTYVEEKQQGRW